MHESGNQNMCNPMIRGQLLNKLLLILVIENKTRTSMPSQMFYIISWWQYWEKNSFCNLQKIEPSNRKDKTIESPPNDDR